MTSVSTSKAPSRWMIYGANGYTARLITRLALERGHRPVIAGRHPQRLLEISEKTGLPVRVFDLKRADLVAKQLEDIDVVLHCAGPFSSTCKPMLDACIKANVHYLDITGEIEVFEMVQARDRELRDARVTAIPGIGFDVVPTDCLAAMLKAAMPDAQTLRLAFKPQGNGISPGTAKTMVEGLGKGGRVRKGGLIIAVPSAHKTMMVPFEGKPRLAVAIPWGDVSTAFHSTGIPNVEVYLGAPAGQIRGMRALRFFRWFFNVTAVQDFLKKRIEVRIKGPSDEQRLRERTHLWGEVENAAGAKRSMTVTTPEGYTLTAESAVMAVERLLKGDVAHGALTPSKAFGAGYLETLSGVVVHGRGP